MCLIKNSLFFFSINPESVVYGVLEPLKSLREWVITRELHCQSEAPGQSQPWDIPVGPGDDAEGRTPAHGKQCGPRCTGRCEMVGAALSQLWWENSGPDSFICQAASPGHSHPGCSLSALIVSPGSQTEPPGLGR